jgi:hypothetical protein
MTTSHPKKSRRRCTKAITEKTMIAIIVNGFMILSLLSGKLDVLTIFYHLYSIVLKSIPHVRITGSHKQIDAYFEAGWLHVEKRIY